MIHNFIWGKLRRFNRIPGAYQAFYIFMNLYYREGQIVTLQRGTASGYKWRHYKSFQPWMTLGVYEPSVAQLIHQSLKPGDIFYDIGANAGYFTLVGAKAVGISGKVIAFEPVAQNANVIQEQIALNKLNDTCRTEQIAISDSNSTAMLTIPSKSANAHLVNVEAPHIKEAKQANLAEVVCITLDSYINNNPTLKPTLIKMDIEGAEVKALKGATELIHSNNAPIFLITAHSELLASQVKSILSDAGYQFGSFQDMIHAIPVR